MVNNWSITPTIGDDFPMIFVFEMLYPAKNGPLQKMHPLLGKDEVTNNTQIWFSGQER